jgi:hypothetical protein
MKKSPWIGTLLILFSMSVRADDLALITVDSEEKAATAREICGSAFLRQEDRFLVAVDEGKSALLISVGIDVSLVAADIDLSSAALFFPDPAGGRDMAGVAQLGRTIHLGHGTQLFQAGETSVASIREESGLKVAMLTDWQTPIEFVAPKVYLHLRADSYPTDSLVQKVSQDSLLAFDQRLEAFYTRYVWSDSIDRARDWMVQKLQSWGYNNVTTPTFSWGGGIHYNVMAVKTGYAEPNSYIVVGGHYDSYNSQSPGSVFAPGADDDGSGTALTLELARVFRNVPTRKSIVFMPFSAEEVGLVGSRAAAQNFKNSGTNVECMYNFDMVAFVTDAVWGLNLSSGGNTAYRQIAADAATRLTSIVPYISSMGSSSDHYSFYQQGFDIVDHIEHNFNFGGWHTNIDLSSRLNFPYFTQVTKIAAAELAISANSGLPGRIEKVVDNGDGFSVTVYIANCRPSSAYWVHHGATSGSLTDSVPVAPGECSVVVGGLVEGQVRYFGVFEKPSDGYRSIWSTQATQTPLLYPRAPRALALDPLSAQISLRWKDNLEGDLDHYLIHRKVEGIGDWMVIGSTTGETTFVDTHIIPQIPYLYAVTAVDDDGYESDLSLTARGYAATFDGGPVIIDELLQENYTLPTQTHQLAWYDSLMNGAPYGVVVADSTLDTLYRGDLARYSSALWIDDDIYVKMLLSDTPQVNWFLSHGTDMMIAGYRTIDKNATSPVPANHLFKSQFGLSTFAPFIQPDFQGAKGQLGWPDVQIDQTRGAWTLNYVSKLVGVAGTTVIYKYDSDADDPATEDQPCGIAWDSPQGKRVLLAFPLWNLTPSTSKALVAKVLQYFGESSGGTVNGDLDGSGGLDIADLTMLIDYLYISLTPPTVMSAADMDQSCSVDISDVTYLIAYLFLNGPEPLAPCGE